MNTATALILIAGTVLIVGVPLAMLTYTLVVNRLDALERELRDEIAEIWGR